MRGRVVRASSVFPPFYRPRAAATRAHRSLVTEENMAKKKKRPNGMVPSRQPERQTKHPTSYSVPLGKLTMPSDRCGWESRSRGHAK